MIRLEIFTDARPECIASVRNVVAGYAGELGLSAVEIYKVKLCVSEAVTNVVEHAYPQSEPGPVEVRVCEDRGELEIIVADHGRMNHETSSDDPGGFGLGFISRLTSHCTFTAAHDGTSVEMRFPLPPTSWHEGRRRDPAGATRDGLSLRARDVETKLAW
jgi:anti-sigma regulatory factor (Ser/Thr protein kinase)